MVENFILDLAGVTVCRVGGRMNDLKIIHLMMASNQNELKRSNIIFKYLFNFVKLIAL